MNKDNFVKECHLLAEDAKLVNKDKNGNVLVPASFWGELSGVLHELGMQTRCPYYIDEKQFDKRERMSYDEFKEMYRRVFGLE